jgi:hypothetical protein
MRLRNTATTKYISCIGCKHYDYGLCKKTHEFEPIKEKNMYPLASSYRKICGYKNPKHYASIVKQLEDEINIQIKVTKATFLLTPIFMTIGIHNLSSIFISGSCSLGIFCYLINHITLPEKKRLELINKSKK